MEPIRYTNLLPNLVYVVTDIGSSGWEVGTLIKFGDPFGGLATMYAKRPRDGYYRRLHGYVDHNNQEFRFTLTPQTISTEEEMYKAVMG